MKIVGRTKVFVQFFFCVLFGEIGAFFQANDYGFFQTEKKCLEIKNYELHANEARKNMSVTILKHCRKYAKLTPFIGTVPMGCV